jgi:hypothetical protein
MPQGFQDRLAENSGIPHPEGRLRAMVSHLQPYESIRTCLLQGPARPVIL